MARAGQDVLAVLRGLQLVAEALCHEQRKVSKHLWSNSSIRELLEENLKVGAEYLKSTGQNPSKELKKLQEFIEETRGRTCAVAEGVKQLAGVRFSQEFKMNSNQFSSTPNATGSAGAGNVQAHINQQRASSSNTSDRVSMQSNIDAANLDISSITLKELEDILSKRHKDREISLRTAATKSKQVVEPQREMSSAEPVKSTKDEFKADTEYVKNVLTFVAGDTSTNVDTTDSKAQKSLPSLSTVAKQRKVPSSRLGRMASFGGLFAGLGIGTINELTKGALGMGGSKNVSEALFSPANAERIVDTLCKVRGAALKIGQILSIQDSNVVSPQLAKAFERVRQAADYMPDWQLERVMSTQLGPDWRNSIQDFDDKPFAAASIGQVHRATLKNGMVVAIKVQYPGVAQSIESDIDNLVGMLKVWDVFPHGFFIDNVVKVAKRELTWEVDYTREAEYTEKFKEMVAPYNEYYVPSVIRDLTTSSVLTTELVPGVPLDKCFEMSYDHRKHIGESVLKLCLRELFELQCMQTDPNWSNFLYDADSRRLMLIDFGSTRFYQKEFIRNYRNVIMCAVNNNRQGVLEISRDMGFLTGYETKQMEEAHVDAVMILGEMFRYEGEFDFGKQNTTERIAHLVPTMVAHRLCPPPEEIYSIHRKLSGIFLLCARLKIKLKCRPLFDDIVVGKFKE
ncbi:atypical kinase COQ8B, mitochondrial [Lucilia sericata]|uniref:atypical kinase COQ8B, mitochondrial n=1 Tax=Lucilia sericata TaxID=13632 RepID=UPI0018A81032|nr:atypical kinase COQ8B, mitochondrial [Lucilia sericata]